jgi:hypothetical protein
MVFAHSVSVIPLLNNTGWVYLHTTPFVACGFTSSSRTAIQALQPAPTTSTCRHLPAPIANACSTTACWTRDFRAAPRHSRAALPVRMPSAAECESTISTIRYRYGAARRARAVEFAQDAALPATVSSSRARGTRPQDEDWKRTLCSPAFRQFAYGPKLVLTCAGLKPCVLRTSFLTSLR